MAVVLPDTSPRGAGIEGEDDDWDFGTGEWVRFDSGVVLRRIGFQGFQELDRGVGSSRSLRRRLRI